MKTEKITVEDIRGIGTYGKLVAKMPSYLATVSVRNLVSYVRKAYTREDGLDYATSTDTKTNTITISTVDR
jgi:hypothetical protein